MSNSDSGVRLDSAGLWFDSRSPVSILIHMMMTKRIQIPIDEPELAFIKAAAMRAGLPVAEWARSLLKEEARRTLGEGDLTPDEAFAVLCGLEAPIADVDTMIEESMRGRFR